MIPRYQRILFWTLANAILVMALLLLRGCHQTREKLTRRADETPIAAPLATTSETVQLAMASDATGTIALEERDAPLPEEPTARVRALLTRLIAEYSYKNSKHPLESGPAVDDVFLLDLPLRGATALGSGATAMGGGTSKGAATATVTERPVAGGADATRRERRGQLAVVNLHGAFADHHPSGIEEETLTIESMIGTLRANFPKIEQARFLVDGQPRGTLNGHADLTRVYEVNAAPGGLAAGSSQAGGVVAAEGR